MPFERVNDENKAIKENTEKENLEEKVEKDQHIISELNISKKIIDTKEETFDPEKSKIIIKGPLSAIYTKALNEVYKNKKVNVDTKIMPLELGKENDKEVYAVDEKDLSKYGSEAANFIYDKSCRNRSLILKPSKDRHKLREAIEVLAEDQNIPIFNSLEHFIVYYK